MSYIIKAENLSFSYDDDDKAKKTVENLNIEIERSTFTAIIGHNGSGKSTIAKLICAVLEPDSGEIYVDSASAGRVLRASSEDDIFDIRKAVGMVFQNPDNQLVATVVEEDVAFAPENMGVEPSEIRKRVDKALLDVGLYELRLHDTHKLSGGQKQRVAIAGILAMSPECVIFDESTSMLDPKGRADIMDIIMKLKNELGITVILITHYMNEAALADRILVADDGKIVLDGTPEEVFDHKELLENCGLELPQSSELVRRLHDAGFDIRKTVLDLDSAFDAIVEAASKKNS